MKSPRADQIGSDLSGGLFALQIVLGAFIESEQNRRWFFGEVYWRKMIENDGF